MATLQGQPIKDTYQSLLKTDGNTSINNSLQTITDGQGNASALSLNTVSIHVSGGIQNNTTNINAPGWYANDGAIVSGSRYYYKADVKTIYLKPQAGFYEQAITTSVADKFIPGNEIAFIHTDSGSLSGVIESSTSETIGGNIITIITLTTDPSNGRDDTYFGFIHFPAVIYDLNTSIMTGYSGSVNGLGRTDGWNNQALGIYAIAEGDNTTADGYGAHAEGWNTVAGDSFTHAEGENTTAKAFAAHAEGYDTKALGPNSHAEGFRTTTTEDAAFAHAEGQLTTAIGVYSHAEGYGTRAINNQSHAEGYQAWSYGQYSHAEGDRTYTEAQSSHAEGYGTTTLGNSSHAEGYATTTIAFSSHTEGDSTVTIGAYSHAEGKSTTAKGDRSHAEGLYTIARSTWNGSTGIIQHAEGRFNIEDTTSLLIVGNGTGTGSRANAFSVATFGTSNTGSALVVPYLSASLDFADDTAAAANGVPLGGLYRSGSFVLVRLV